MKEQIEAYISDGNIVVNEQRTSKKEAIEVYAEVTPNPAVMKFGVNKALTQTDVEFKNIDEANVSSPLAQAIFNFPFVKEVFIFVFNSIDLNIKSIIVSLFSCFALIFIRCGIISSSTNL